MRKTIIVCDRCKKTFSLTYNERNNRNLKLVDYEDSEYDICPECFESLNEWFDSGESEEEKEVDG